MLLLSGQEATLTTDLPGSSCIHLYIFTEMMHVSLCIKECISVIRIRTGGDNTWCSLCDFRFDTAGYDIRLYPIRQDGMDGRGWWTNAD